jgi:hypothetical protein
MQLWNNIYGLMLIIYKMTGQNGCHWQTLLQITKLQKLQDHPHSLPNKGFKPHCQFDLSPVVTNDINDQ